MAGGVVCERSGGAENDRRAEHRKDSDDRSASETESDALGRDALLQQRHDRIDDALAEERPHALRRVRMAEVGSPSARRDTRMVPNTRRSTVVDGMRILGPTGGPA
jgi:hypothetical protein